MFPFCSLFYYSVRFWSVFHPNVRVRVFSNMLNNMNNNVWKKSSCQNTCSTDTTLILGRSANTYSNYFATIFFFLLIKYLIFKYWKFGHFYHIEKLKPQNVWVETTAYPPYPHTHHPTQMPKFWWLADSRHNKVICFYKVRRKKRRKKRRGEENRKEER